MDVRIQQRLVGALVILALVFLVAPVVLDGDGRLPEKITQIPPKPKRPDVSHIRVAEPSQDVLPELPDQPPESVPAEPASTEPALNVAAQTYPTESAEPAPVEPQPQPQPTVGDAWSVQVASFSESAKAARLRDRLREEGFSTYVNEVILSDGTLFTQVLVGPETDMDRVRARKEEIKTRIGMQGLVVRYKP